MMFAKDCLLKSLQTASLLALRHDLKAQNSNQEHRLANHKTP